MTELLKLDIETDINKLNFKSGVEELDYFFYNISKEYIKEDYAQVYYLKKEDNNHIIAYFAISCSAIEFKKELQIKKKIKYIPCTLIGRFAVDKDMQRKGHGTDLIKIALNLSLRISNDIGCRLVIVDAKTNLQVLQFYKKLDFEYFKSFEGLKIERALQKNQKPSSPTIVMYFNLHKLKS